MIGEVILGVFIVFPRDTIIIKRGTKDDKSLVFISNTSDIADQIGLPPKLGSGEIFVSLRPQLIPVEERFSPFPRRGGGTFGIASAFGTANVTANQFGTACADGMTVVSDSVRSAGAQPVCVSGSSGEDHSSGSAGAVKKSNESVVDGSTVLGKPTGQRFQMSSKFPTLGCHIFRFLLQVGDSNLNVIYNGYLDDDGSPISRPFPYTILE